MKKIQNPKSKIQNKFQFKNIQNFFVDHKSSIINHQSGFTLIELLVVIAVVATFLTVGLGSFSTAQRKARDTKRKSDIKEIHSALEQYYSVCGNSYPDISGSFYTSVNCPTPPISIMPTVPIDPRQVTPYYCPTPAADNCNGNGFTICAVLETEANPFCVNNSQ
jgi:prepilin-type N-terminal cleavage/methylation domain-containing protein